MKNSEPSKANDDSGAADAPDASGATDAPQENDQNDPKGGDLTPVLEPESIVPPGVLERLPPRVREVVLRAASFSGPLPPSQMFREYEHAVPGSGNRIVKMAEDQQAHRIEWERAAMREESKATGRGQWFGFIVSLACIAAAVYLAAIGKLVVSGILVTVGGSGLMGNLVSSFRRDRSNGNQSDPH